MENTVLLKDGTEVIIRPLRKDDIDRSLAFFRSLPLEDRLYLRKNVTRIEVVMQRIRDVELNTVRRVVALSGDDIIADGSLELEPPGWKGHMGEIRVIVARRFQRKGLGLAMVRELYLMAASEKVEDLVVKMMAPQIAARKIVEKLGFNEDMTLTNYVRDIQGERHDLIVMRCNLNSAWDTLDEYFTDTDWERRK